MTCGGLTMSSPRGRSIHVLMAAPQPIFEPRGTPFSVVYRIRALCKAGHRVDLVTYPYGRDPRIDGLRMVRVPKLPGVSGVKIGPSVPKLFLDAMMAVWILGMVCRRRYDCIWSHEEAGLFCGLVSRVLGIPHVYDMHSDLSQQIGNFRKYNLRPIVGVFRAWEQLTLRMSDVVLTICDDLLETVRRVVPGKRVILAENYCTEVDFLDDAVPSVEELRERHGVENSLVALYIGSLESYQGIDILTGAATELKSKLNGETPAWKMLIVGGREAQVSSLRAEVSRLGLDGVVEVVGSVSPPVVDVYVRMCDVLLSARSKGTNVPLKLYSYMKSGKAILATNIYSHTQLLTDENSVLADPTGEAFGEGLGRLLGDEGLRKRVSENASREAMAFSNEVFERNIAMAVDWAMSPAGAD